MNKFKDIDSMGTEDIVRYLNANRRVAAIAWYPQDILERNDTLTVTEVNAILKLLISEHDAANGINWDTIDYLIYGIKGGG